MIVLAALLTAAVFAGIVVVVVRMSHGRLPGEFDAPPPPVRQVQADQPSASAPVELPESTVPIDPDLPESDLAEVDDFEQWEAEHWPRTEQ